MVFESDAPGGQENKSLAGYHNDLIADGKRYHVLTEDLGPRHALVVTQAFCAGAVIATKKSEYPAVDQIQDLQAAVVQLMQHQHKAMMHRLATKKGSAEPAATPRPTLVMKPVETPTKGTFAPGARGGAQIVAPEEAAHIEICGGTFAGERFALHCSPLSFGRTASLAIDDPTLDPMACLFFRADDGWRVASNPIGSGMFVNGKRYSTKTLVHGDMIRVGKFDIRFLEVSRMGPMILEEPARLEGNSPAFRATLLPLLAHELGEPHEDFEGRTQELEERIGALAAFGPSSTPMLFPDREAQLAYYLNAFVAVASLGLIRARRQKARGERTTGLDLHVEIDHRQSSVVELDTELCRFQEPRIFAAVRLAIRTCNVEAPFTADDLDLRLDEAMKEMVNDPEQVRIDHKNKRVILPGPAWPFRAPLDSLLAYAAASRRAQFVNAEAMSYRVAFG